jgi:hypothetical protein
VAVDGRYAAGEKGAFEHTKSEPFARVVFKKANPRSSHRRCLDASDDQLLSLAERAVASAVVLMTLTLRIETRRRFFFFFFRASFSSRAPPAGWKRRPRASDASDASDAPPRAARDE